VWLLSLLVSCGGAEPRPEPVFVRDGIWLDGELRPREWVPGEQMEIAGIQAIAPARAECVSLFHADLGDVSPHVARGGEAPDTALAFSPDGKRLAIGAFTGEIAVVDAWTGAEVARRALPEALVKQVAWSADGSVLYAAEQSPDALLHALDPVTLADRWTVRLADEVGSSPAPRGDDLYGVYQLPSVLGLAVLPGGDLIVSAVHGWQDADGSRRNRSRLLRLDSAGKTVAAWPPDGTADATLFYPRVDLGGGLVAVPVGRSAAGDPPAGLPIGGIQVLELAGLTPKGAFVAEPLPPWYTSVFVWEAADVSAAQDVVAAGLADGRLVTWRLSDGAVRATVDLGTPITSAGVPISASIGFAAIAGDTLLSETSGTNIPFGAADPALRPPSAHPNANALWAHDLDGTLKWTWRGLHDLQGLTVSDDGKWLVAGAGPRSTDQRTDLFGALVFRAEGEGTGEERLEAFCATASPVFFRHALAPDGRIAVAEHPWLGADGAVHGTYRVTVLR
jgi:hypothetical protein